MPLGDIAGEALGGILRFLGRILVEFVFELLIKGAGHVLIRLVRPRSEPSDSACAIVGLLFWAALVVGGYCIYQATAA